jgi:hypothetical protein
MGDMRRHLSADTILMMRAAIAQCDNAAAFR